MFFKNKEKSAVDIEQHELLENAQRRVKQKKRLFSHFVIFLIGSVFLILINKILKFQEQYDWFIWAITAWAFLFIIHAFNVFVTHQFMGKDWERKREESYLWDRGASYFLILFSPSGKIIIGFHSLASSKVIRP